MRVRTRAVIFDMDGVITNTMPTHFRIWKQIFKEEGIHVTRLDIYQREGQRGIESLKELFHLYGKAFTSQRAHAILKRKESIFKDRVKSLYIPGARSFLKEKSREGFRLALVTGTSRHEAEKLLPESVFKLFEVTVCGCEVNNGKPHPEPYLKALHHLSLPSKDAVVIENAPFGIRSARAAGLRCLAVATSLPHAYLNQATAVFDSFQAMKKRVTFIKP